MREAYRGLALALTVGCALMLVATSSPAQNKDDDFDMFIEDIGFTETRNYVKKVLGNYWTYKLLKKTGSYYLY